MKILIVTLTLLTLAACETPSVAQKETTKTLQQKSASERINSTNRNSDNLFKEIDQ